MSLLAALPATDRASLVLLAGILLILFLVRRRQPQEHAQPAVTTAAGLSTGPVALAGTPGVDPMQVLVHAGSRYLGPEQGGLALALLDPLYTPAEVGDRLPADLAMLLAARAPRADARGSDDPAAAAVLTLLAPQPRLAEEALVGDPPHPGVSRLRMLLVVVMLAPLLLRLLMATG